VKYPLSSQSDIVGPRKQQPIPSDPRGSCSSGNPSFMQDFSRQIELAPPIPQALTSYIVLKKVRTSDWIGLTSGTEVRLMPADAQGAFARDSNQMLPAVSWSTNPIRPPAADQPSF
jgi:hypothetical protein